MEKGNKRILIITGASKGIGKAIALKLCDEYLVINLSRTILDDDRIINITTDVTNYNQVEFAFSTIMNMVGNPTVLINNAGCVIPSGINDLKIEDWHKVINTNLNGAFYCCKQFLNHTTSGIIINIGSTSGTRPCPNNVAYASAKAGLINFSLSLEEELKGLYKVYTISPGRCATDLRKKLAPEEDPKTIMSPEDIANFIFYLLNSDNRLYNNIFLRK